MLVFESQSVRALFGHSVEFGVKTKIVLLELVEVCFDRGSVNVEVFDLQG